MERVTGTLSQTDHADVYFFLLNKNVFKTPNKNICNLFKLS